MKTTIIVTLAAVAILFGANRSASADPVIIDHTSITSFNSLPDYVVDAITGNLDWHYAHTSHGGQLTTGLSRLENYDPRLDVTRYSSSLPPVNPDSLCIFDGQEPDTYITPDEYWDGAYGQQLTRNVLNNNPRINISAFCWCGQMSYNSTAYTQSYLITMAAFETEFPDVTFVYMTGHAQYTGSSGLTRYINNEMIRDWVAGSDNRVLFDFADLDAWWFNPATQIWEFASYEYNSQTIPVEHSHFNGSQSGHTTYESCEQKGKGVWMMMSEIVACMVVYGDYNNDGYTDQADYTVWADSYNETGSDLPADGNNDGIVDQADYTIWADNYGMGTLPPQTPNSVPEPATLILLAGALTTVAGKKVRHTGCHQF